MPPRGCGSGACSACSSLEGFGVQADWRETNICNLSRIPLAMCTMEAGIVMPSCVDCFAVPRAWWHLLRLQRKEAPAMRT